MRNIDKIGLIVILVVVFLLAWFSYFHPRLCLKNVDGHDCIDLGLPSGTLWATCNIDADSPYEYGGHYSWGEVTSKDTFRWNTYKYCEGKRFSLTKYNNDTTFGPILDTLTRLTSSDDVVSHKWGNKWCMPTNDQIRELFDNCEVGPFTDNGRHYCKFIGPNKQQLIIPYAGWRIRSKHRYSDSLLVIWSRDLRIEKPEMAYALVITRCKYPGDTRFTRNFGFSVRGVVKMDAKPGAYWGFMKRDLWEWLTSNMKD